jgi:hypothetical protein
MEPVRALATLFLMVGLALWSATQLNAVTAEWESLATEHRLQTASQALQGYKRFMGRYPSEFPVMRKTLKNPRLSKKERLCLAGIPAKDGWGRPWKYEVQHQGKFFRLYSLGLNGLDDDGEPDDILVP